MVLMRPNRRLCFANIAVKSTRQLGSSSSESVTAPIMLAHYRITQAYHRRASAT